MQSPQFWHMQLNPGESLGREKVVRILKETSFIGFSTEDDEEKTYRDFTDVMHIGDIVCVRDGKMPIALVEVTGNHEREDYPNEDLDWFQERRKVRVLGYATSSLGDFPKPRGTLERLIRDTPSKDFIASWYTSIRGDSMVIEAQRLLEANLQIVLTGAPGTGKTFLAHEIAARILECEKEELDGNPRFGFVQFHPSYDYCDFVEGLKPTLVDGNVVVDLKDGIFKKFCKLAVEQEDEAPFVFVIDEINRADLSRVFGELFFAIEPGYRGRLIPTQYSYLSNERLAVPKKVLLIGTMNDIDRSVESIDFALRRRFAWLEIEATEGLFTKIVNNIGDHFDSARKSYMDLNDAILEVPTLGKAYQIGPAYFRNLERYFEFENPLAELWKNHLLVLIREYLRGLPDSREVEDDLRGAFFHSGG